MLGPLGDMRVRLFRRTVMCRDGVFVAVAVVSYDQFELLFVGHILSLLLVLVFVLPSLLGTSSVTGISRCSLVVITASRQLFSLIRNPGFEFADCFTLDRQFHMRISRLGVVTE